MDKTVLLSQMTWPEVKARLPKVRVAILPVGSSEQHGPHLTFETDIAIATELAQRLAVQHFPLAVVAPPLPVGMSNHHMRFPGTISWRHETFRAAIEDTIFSLHEHGIDRFLVLNGHGGNRAALTILGSELRYATDIMVASCTWFELVRDVCRKFIPARRVHADEIEAAMGLYLAPRIVRREQLAPGKAHADPFPHTDPGTGGGFDVPYRWGELTANGAYGDARRATVGIGRELTEAFLKRAGEFVTAFMAQGAGGAKRKRRRG